VAGALSHFRFKKLVEYDQFSSLVLLESGQRAGSADGDDKSTWTLGRIFNEAFGVYSVKEVKIDACQVGQSLTWPCH